jgi:hypothetical protein
MRKLLPFATILLAFLVAAPTTLAQLGVEVHRLEIRDGRVLHDGVELPASALPEDFDPGSLSFTFEYSGPVMPALTLNGQVYALEGERLIRIEDASASEGVRAVAMMPADHASPQERRRQAEDAYLRTLSERDRALYERLMEERDMEEEALRLAYAARRATDPADRDRLRQQLHQQVSEMFDLKQGNRQDEIRQVEEFLEILRRQMADREAAREDLIRQHVSELLGDQ